MVVGKVGSMGGPVVALVAVDITSVAPCADDGAVGLTCLCVVALKDLCDGLATGS